MKEVKVYLMGECDVVVSHLSIEETNEWYNEKYAECELEEVCEIDMEIEEMWYRISHEEPHDLAKCDEFKEVYGDLFKKMTYKEALRRDGGYKEPYIIASLCY